MKLLIVGHSVVDHIYDGLIEKISPGGIFYSAVGFNAMKALSDKCFLLTSQSTDDEDLFNPLFSKFDLSYVNRLQKIPHVNLYLDGTAERREHYENFAGNLQVEGNIPLNDFDGIYINMITGSDLTTEQIRNIRNNYEGKIYLDVHTLSRGMGKDHHRFFRKIENYKSYLSNIDIVQVNEHELKTISPFDEPEKIKKEVFDLGVKVLIVTKGENGVEAYSSSGKSVSLDAISVKVVNKVGCGDIFGSVFFYNYITDENLERSLEVANCAAGLATEFNSADELIKLNYDIIKGHIEN